MDTPEQILELLRCCGHHLHRHWGHGKASQNRTLRILNEYGELSQRQLQDLMRIQQGSLSEVVKKLESQGLIVRRRDSNDQRQLFVQLTEAGKQQYQFECKNRMQQGQELMAALNAEEQQQLQSLLAKLHESWKARDGRPNSESPGHPRHGAEDGQVNGLK